MSGLEDLQQSLDSMSNEELLEKIREIRRSRRQPKVTAKSLAKKAKAKKKSVKKKTIEQKMADMDPDALLKMLEAAESKLKAKKGNEQ